MYTWNSVKRPKVIKEKLSTLKCQEKKFVKKNDLLNNQIIYPFGISNEFTDFSEDFFEIFILGHSK